MRNGILLAAIFAFLLPSSVFAQNRCNNVVRPVQHVEVFDRVVPVAVPVVFAVGVPAISYNWNGGYSPVYAPTQPAMQPGSRASFVSLSDTDIDFLISKIEQRLAARSIAKPTSPPPIQPPINKAPDYAAPNDAEVIKVLTTPRGVANKSCANCHTGATAKKGMVIFTSPGVLNPNADWASIWNEADEGNMPPEAKTNKEVAVTDAEADILRKKMLSMLNSRK